MDLKTLVQWVLDQGKYAVVAVIVYNTVKHFSKSKIAGIISSLIIGSLAYFFLNDPNKVLTAIGGVLGKIFGG